MAVFFKISNVLEGNFLKNFTGKMAVNIRKEKTYIYLFSKTK
jgi:hypothetical protein